MADLLSLPQQHHCFSNKDHIMHVREVMTTLHDTRASFKLRKSEFLTNTVKYLGQIVRPVQLTIDKTLVKSLMEAREPQKQTILCFFLGLVNEYRRFIAEVADIAALLNAVLRKG